VSVAIDGGGALHLDALAADMRLRAEAGGDGTRVHILLGGIAERAAPIGAVAPEAAVEAAMRVLAEIAARGEEARAREVVRQVGAAPFRSLLADMLLPGEIAAPAQRPRAEPVGLHMLEGGDAALGLGLAFGHTDADALESLVEAAMRAHASGIRAAPDRALLVIGIAPEQAGALVAVADTLGFVTRSGDPRRSIAACPGAPLCACTDLPTRALAPAIAESAASILDGSITVHLSGCGKGCAHQGPAALAVIGSAEDCGVVVNAAARDRPLVMLAAEALPACFTQLAQVCAAERLAGEDAAAILSRLGPARIAVIMAEGAHA
jgi:precorrin-3B synthase